MTAEIHDFPPKRRPAVTYGSHDYDPMGTPGPSPKPPERIQRGPMRHRVQVLFEDGKIDLHEYAVLHRLVDFAGRNDIFPGMSKLAGSRATAKRIIKRLEAKGYVTRVQRSVKGRKITNQFYLNL